MPRRKKNKSYYIAKAIMIVIAFGLILLLPKIAPFLGEQLMGNVFKTN